MPIYEYQCETCDKVFEVFQRHSDPPPDGHDCGGTRVRRLLSNTSFILKGTGWYATDYAAPAKAEKKEGGPGEAGGEARAGESRPQEQARADGGTPAASSASGGDGAPAKSSDGGDKGAGGGRGGGAPASPAGARSGGTAGDSGKRGGGAAAG